MKITDLAEYKGETWFVELDGGSKFYINRSVVEEFSLSDGMSITPAALEQIKGADVLRKAKKRALYLLGERDMCRGELHGKLTKTYGEEIAGEAVDYVSELGYINDEEYAQKLAEYLIKRKRWGIYRAKRDMIHRGLDAELVENTLAEFSEEELDEELIELIEKKYLSKISDYDDKRRTIAALMRRGYGYASIKRCIERISEDEESDDFFEDDEDYYYEDD